jgi:hypothetical protein
MGNRIYDIIPPGNKQKKSYAAEVPVFIKKKAAVSGINPAGDASGKKRIKTGYLSKILLGFSFLILASLSLWLAVFSKVNVEIWPKIYLLNNSKTIIGDVGQENLDSSLWLEKGVVPAEIFKDLKFDSQEFQSTGKLSKEEKAKGMIRIYNNFSENPQSLIANTRFVSADGKLFRLQNKISVPGATRDSKGKLVAGEIDATVLAAEPGKDYNITPTNFSIPGFAGTSKYTSIYAKSFSNMAGGFKGEVAQVLEDDLDKAREEMLNKLKNESIDSLKKTLPANYVLLDGGVSQEVAEEEFSLKAGEEAESFTLKLKVESKAVIFKQSDIEKLAKDIINSNIESEKKFKENDLELNYDFKSLGFEQEQPDLESFSGDSDKNAKSQNEQQNKDIPEAKKSSVNNPIKIVFDIKVTAKTYIDAKLDEIKHSILGKSLDEVKVILKDQPGN